MAEIDTTTGGLATPFCPREYRSVESFAPGTAPVTYCPIHSQMLGVPGMTPTPAQPPVGGGARGRGRAARGPHGGGPGDGRRGGDSGGGHGGLAAATAPEAPTARPATVPPPRP